MSPTLFSTENVLFALSVVQSILGICQTALHLRISWSGVKARKSVGERMDAVQEN